MNFYQASKLSDCSYAGERNSSESDEIMSIPTKRFHGRHLIWTVFDLSQGAQGGYYFCRASDDCVAAYHWPPSTTVAGRHLRDKHPDVLNELKTLETERQRENGNEHNFPFWMREDAAPTSAQTSKMRKRAASGVDGLYSADSRSTEHRYRHHGGQQMIYSDSKYLKVEEPLLTECVDESIWASTSTSSTCRRTRSQQDSATLAGIEEPIEEQYGCSAMEDEVPDSESTAAATGHLEFIENQFIGDYDHQYDEESTQLQRSRSNSSVIPIENRELDSHFRIEQRCTSPHGKGRNAGIDQRWETHEKTLTLKRKLAECQDELKRSSDKYARVQAQLHVLSQQNKELSSSNNNLLPLQEKLTQITAEKERIEREFLKIHSNSPKPLSEDGSKKSNSDFVFDDDQHQKRLTSFGDAESMDNYNNHYESKTQREHIVNLKEAVTRLECELIEANERSKRDLETHSFEIKSLKDGHKKRVKMFEDQIQDLNTLKIVQNKQIYELQTQLDGIESNNSVLDIQGRTSDQVEISSTSNSNDESQPTIKRLKALLRDSELALSMEEEANLNHVKTIRSLKAQLDEAESELQRSERLRTSCDSELIRLRAQFQASVEAQSAAESIAADSNAEANIAITSAKEMDERLQTLQQKYAIIQEQSTNDATQLAEQKEKIAALQRRSALLQEQLNRATSAAEFNALHTVDKHTLELSELKLRETSAKLELENSHRQRLEVLLARQKDDSDLLAKQLDRIRQSKEVEIERTNYLKKETLRLSEQLNESHGREAEFHHKIRALKQERDHCSQAADELTNELKLATQRIASFRSIHFQTANCSETETRKSTLSERHAELETGEIGMNTSKQDEKIG